MVSPCSSLISRWCVSPGEPYYAGRTGEKVGREVSRRTGKPRLLDGGDRVSLCLSLPFMLGIALGKAVADRTLGSTTPIWRGGFGSFVEGAGSVATGKTPIQGPYALLLVATVMAILSTFGVLVVRRSRPQRGRNRPGAAPRSLLCLVEPSRRSHATLILFFLASCVCGICRYASFRAVGEGDIWRVLQSKDADKFHVFEITALKCTPLGGLREEVDESEAEVDESEAKESRAEQIKTRKGRPDVPRREAISRFQVVGQIHRMDGRRVSGRAVVFLYAEAGKDGGKSDPSAGSLLFVRGRIRRPQRSKNPGLPGERDRTERLGAFWVVDASSWEAVPTGYTGTAEKEIRRFVGGTSKHVTRSLSGAADRFRLNLIRKVSETMPAETAGFYRAILLGDRSCIPPDTSDAFAAIGLSHILALSGLHVVLVAGGIRWLLGTFKMACAKAVIGAFGQGQRSGIRVFAFSPLVDLALTAVSLMTYATITGGAPSVLRASFMFLSALAAPVMGRCASSMNALWLSAFLILLFDPQSLFDTGFQLSFLATWGILKYNRRFQNLIPWCPAEVMMTLSSQLGTLPILAGTFGRFSIVSFLANPLMLPFVGLLVNYGLMLLALCAIFPLAAGVLYYPASWGISAFLGSSRWMASLPLTSLAVYRPHWLLLVAYFALIWIWSFPGTGKVDEESGRGCSGKGGREDGDKGGRRGGDKGGREDGSAFISNRRAGRRPVEYRNARRILLTLMIALAWLTRGFTEIPPGMMEVTFFDVGQGDGALIRTAGVVIVVDTGPSHGRSPRSMAELLRIRGVGHIDCLVLSHGHGDHTGGVEEIIDTFSVGSIVIPESQVGTNEFRTILSRASRKRIRVVSLKEGDVLELGNKWSTVDGFVRKMNTLTATVLHPQRGSKGSVSSTTERASDFMNETSLVFCLDFGRQRFIWTGDVGASSENLILEDDSWLKLCGPKTNETPDGPKQTMILKVAHHGSSTSTTDEFLDEVRPAVAVIQVGKNDFGHPGEEVLNRLASRGIIVLRTDRDGAITFRTDGERWFVRSWLPPEATSAGNDS